MNFNKLPIGHQGNYLRHNKEEALILIKNAIEHLIHKEKISRNKALLSVKIFMAVSYRINIDVLQKDVC